MVKISELAILLDEADLSTRYKGDGEVHGFHRSNLEIFSQKVVKEKRWENLEDLLALLVFGLVLFPNLENFIDDTTISVFWATTIFDEDYVPALLGDVYYTLELRYIKRIGLMLCCITLLYQRFMAQISPRSSTLKMMDRGESSQKLVSLNEKNPSVGMLLR